MRNFAKMSLFVLLTFCFQLAAFAQDTRTEDRQPGAFNAIKCSGSFDLVLEKGNKESIHIEAKNIALEDIITEVKDGTLDIRLKNGSYRNIEVKMTITFDKINALHSSGSSEIVSNAVIKSDKFDLKLSGSGDVKAKLDVDLLNLSISGSADADLSGEAKSQEISLSGSGDVDAADLKSETAIIRISGSGDVKVYAQKELDAKVSGSGNVSFKGEPEKQMFKSSGSGSIVKMN